MSVRTFVATLLFLLALNAQTLRVAVRAAVQPWKNGPWTTTVLSEEIDPSHTALILCDMWDKHWCKGATQRVGELRRRLAKVVDQARKGGVLIIHAPSETMDFYKDAPQRKAILAFPSVTPPPALNLTDPPLPID